MQIAQIEKYNSAVHTFQSKYGGLPGDIYATNASAFGFTLAIGCVGTTKGRRDGNGLIDGDPNSTTAQATGETALFWIDLSTANLIDGTFPNSGGVMSCVIGSSILSSTTMGEFLPVAKIGYGNYLYVYDYSGTNWYGLSAATSVDINSTLFSNATIPVIQAYNIDQKMDDGIPTTGSVLAVYLNNTTTTPALAPNTATSGGNSTSCYDTTTKTYSTSQNNGNGTNCALSFRLQ